MGWKLITLDESKHGGSAPPFCLKILRSATFRLLMMGVILANGIVTATMTFKHDETPRYEFYQNYYYIEIAFTIFLDLETLFKIWCLGFRGYFKHSIHKFELLLAIGTTIHILPGCYLSGLTYFQVKNFFFLFLLKKFLIKFCFLFLNF